MKNCWKNQSQIKFLEKGLGRYLHRERLKYIRESLDRIDRERPDKKALIDLGCGEGVLTNNLQNDNFRIFAIDYDFDRILQAKAKSYSQETFIVSDVLKLALKNEIADVVILHHVIEHLKGADEKILEICYNLIKDDGYLIVGVPNEDSLLGKTLRKIHHKLYAKGEHVNFYSEKTILELLRKKCFSIELVARIGFIFPIYYIHIILIGIKPIFYFMNYLTKIVKFSADSLIIICKKKPYCNNNN